MKTPVLNTERLLLRPFQEGDGPEVFQCWESDAEVAKYMFWVSHHDINKSIQWVKEEIKKINDDQWYRFALVSKESNKLIGTCLIYYEEEIASWEVAYNLGKKYWGKGYTTEAMKKVIEFSKTDLKLKEIAGRHAKENIASENILKKLGFSFVKDISYECNKGSVIRKGKLYKLYLE